MKRLIEKNNIMLLFIVMISLAAVFNLPYHAGDLKPALSASYNYGFDNRLGILILGICCVVLLLFCFKKKTMAEPVKKNIVSFTDERSGISKLFMICLIMEVIICLGIWMVLRGNNTGLGETGYFLPRLYARVQGYRSYQEVDFIYGPVLIEGPYFVYKILSVFGGVVEDGYYCFLLMTQCAGLYFLYDILGCLKLEIREKRNLFILLFIMSIPVAAGLNGGFFRFLMPFYSVLLVLRKKGKDWPGYYVSMTVMEFLTIYTSPELGMVFAVSYGVSCILQAVITKEHVKENICSAILGTAILAAAFFMDRSIFTGVFSIASGGLNWPFIVSFPVVLFFLCLFYFAGCIGYQLKDVKENYNVLTMELMAACMIPSAAGFCEVGHILSSGLMIFVIDYCLLDSKRKKNLLIACMAVLVVIQHSYLARADIPSYMLAALRKTGNQNPVSVQLMSGLERAGYSRERMSELLYKGSNQEINDYMEKLNGYSDIAVPFGLKAGYFIAMLKQEKIHLLACMDPGYYGTSEMIEANLESMAQDRPHFLALPGNWDKKDQVNDYKGLMKRLLFADYRGVLKNNGNALYSDTLSFIKENYEKESDLTDGYILMRERKKEWN